MECEVRVPLEKSCQLHKSNMDRKVLTRCVPIQPCACPLNMLLNRLLTVPHFAMRQDIAENPVGGWLGWCAGCDRRFKVRRCADIVSEDEHVS